MVKKVSKLVSGLYFLIFAALFMSACNTAIIDDGIPQVYVYETINLNNYQYQPLSVIGGYVYIVGGVRGIIVYRQTMERFIAFERNCTFQPMSECADVSVDNSTLFLIDSCCQSTFDFDGYPTGGPAALPLRKYNTYLDQNYLTITSDLQ